MQSIQPEEKIRIPFLRWFEKNHNYHECKYDRNGGDGPRMDSIGLIDNHLVLIEFKASVPVGIVKGPGIERKILETLRLIYQGELVENWNCSIPPMVYIVARDIAENSRRALSEMLEKRHQELYFSYDFGIFDGDYVSYGKKNYNQEMPIDLSSIEIEGIPGKKDNRKAKRTMEEFKEIAKENGVEELMEIFLEYAAKHQAVVNRNISNFNYSFPSKATGKNVIVLGVWPMESDTKNGLCISYHLERLNECFNFPENQADKIPGTIPHSRSYDSHKKYLRNLREIQDFWDFIT